MTGAGAEAAIDLGDARLYVAEQAPTYDVPSSALALGGGLREFVVDIHNAPEADRFLAAALAGCRVVIDDDHGNVMSAEEFAMRATS